jgi:hypothetical protein
MVDFTVKVDEAKLAELQQALSGISQGLPKVLTRAVNKTATWAFTRILDLIVGASGLKRKDVRKAVRLRKANYKTLCAIIHIWNKRMPLIWFGARQGAKGVTFRLPAGAESALDYAGSKQGRLLAEHAFIVTMPRSGHEGVFIRTGSKRLPIEEMFGPSPMQLFTGITGLAERLMAESSARLDTELDNQVRVLLQQTGGRSALESRIAA